MPQQNKFVRGDNLSAKTRSIVCNVFGYRWTVENELRASEWFGWKNIPTMPLVTDDKWLAAHAFCVNKDGTLDGRVQHCEPYYFATLDDQPLPRTLSSDVAEDR